MSRNYSQIVCAIWRDKAFRKLTADAQGVYLMLVSQADITSVGSLSITMKRWADYSVDMDIERLSLAIATLEFHRFVVVDHTTEELLVRSFVRWDNGYTIPKRLASIKAAAAALNSELLQQVAAYEMKQLGLAHGLDVEPLDSQSIAIPEPTERLRVVVTLLGTTPQPTTSNKQPASISNGEIHAHNDALVIPRGEI